MKQVNTYLFNSQKFRTVRFFGHSIFSGEIKTIEADEKQSNVINTFLEFNNKDRTRSKEDRKETRYLKKCKCSL